MAHAFSARKHRDEDAQRRRIESHVARHLRELFTRLPMLVGFHLRHDLMVADLSVFGGAAGITTKRLDEIVMQSLLELAECDPAAIVHMRGRTFARTLH
jgi:hypothetical protein